MKNSRLALLASAVLVGGCVGQIGDGVGGGSDSDEPIDVHAAGLEAAFERAAAEFAVPVDLLKAIAWVNTRWEMVEGDEEHEGVPPAWGIMALRGDQLAAGAALVDASEDAVRTDLDTNVRAGAALLSAHADELGIDRSDLGAWAPAVAALSGIEDEAGRREYVVNEVYLALNEGVAVEVEGGALLGRIPPTDVVPDIKPPPFLASHGAVDYAGAIWRGSPNWNYRPGGDIGKVGMVIIHTCEGAYSGCWSWLANSAAGASAHYVVNSSGSEISQLVREAHRAWHIAANYDCSRNGGKECWRNGYSSNHFTVGIEHAGYASQSSFPSGQIEASAKLVCDITRDHGIPRDKYHIVGHGKLQPWNRTDPGPNWPWTHYIDRVRAHCGDGGGSSTTLIVDSNNANNNTSKGYVQVSGNWTASSATAGYYGTGYWWAGTAAVSDGATFWFYMPSAGTKTIDAWWTAGSNRSQATPFVIFDSAGNVLGKVYRNQRTDGSKWVTLGTWNFKAGWNKVVVSRWAAEGDVVIADAIRVR